MQRSVAARVARVVKQDLPVFIAFVKVFWVARGARSRAKLLQLFGFTLWKRALRRSSFVKPFELRLSTPYGEAAVRARDMADITTICAVFAEEEYGVARSFGDVRTILDLGSNIGVSVIYFRLRYPAARIYAVEAEPATFARLQENCGGISNVVLVHAAISSKTGPVEFYPNESSVSGSLFERAGGADPIRVEGFTIDDLIAAHSIGTVDILKFDIEGAEFDAFPASPRTLRETRAVLGEVHPDIGHRSVREFLSLFSGYTIKSIPKEKNRFILKAFRSSAA